MYLAVEYSPGKFASGMERRGRKFITTKEAYPRESLSRRRSATIWLRPVTPRDQSIFALSINRRPDFPRGAKSNKALPSLLPCHSSGLLRSKKEGTKKIRSFGQFPSFPSLPLLLSHPSDRISTFIPCGEPPPLLRTTDPDHSTVPKHLKTFVREYLRRGKRRRRRGRRGKVNEGGKRLENFKVSGTDSHPRDMDG